MTKENRKKVDNVFDKANADYLEYVASQLHMNQSFALDIIIQAALSDARIVGNAVTKLLEVQNYEKLTVNRTYTYKVDLYNEISERSHVMSRTQFINMAIAGFRLNEALHNWLMDYRTHAETNNARFQA